MAVCLAKRRQARTLIGMSEYIGRAGAKANTDQQKSSTKTAEQAETMYQWIARRKGFAVSNTGYFVYVDGLHAGIEGMLDSDNPATAWMKFQTAVIPYVGDDSWVNDALLGAKKTLQKARCPDHAEDCEIKILLDGIANTE